MLAYDISATSFKKLVVLMDCGSTYMITLVNFPNEESIKLFSYFTTLTCFAHADLSRHISEASFFPGISGGEEVPPYIKVSRCDLFADYFA